MTTINRARRAFFKQDRGPSATGHHMPWAAPAFLDACTRCDDCIRVCETAVLIRGDGGFPTVDFSRGGCTFCARCVDVCGHDALEHRSGPAWRLKAVIGEQCLSARGVTCRACGDACDSAAIRFRLAIGGRALPELEHDLCNGCGSCVAICPSHVIQIQEAA
jgi:ferredoxin-type protein NapF